MDTEILERHAPGLVIPDATLTEFVLGRARQRGSKPALVDAVNGQALSYGELPGAVRRLAGGLAAEGVRPGDVLALCAPNGIEFVVTLHAAMTAGAVVATVNPLWTGEGVARQLRQTGARWLVSTPGLVEEKLRDATRGTQVARTFLIGDGAVGGTLFRSGGQRAPGRPVRPSPSAACLLLSSSGTTGLPKSVELTHRNVVANLCQVRRVHNVTEDDVVIAALPMFHCFALYVSVNLSLLQGATVVVPPRFELGAFLRVIEDHKVTRAEVVPPMVLALAASDMVSGYDLASLRVVTSAGAPLSGELARACAARLGCRVKQVYGMTELGGDAWDVDPDDWRHTIEINLRGDFPCPRAVLPAMTARGAGRIINITSQAGVYRWPQVSAYSVSKAAVIKFTENLGAEASRSGVRAFSVHPGLTPIGLSERALASTAPPGSAEARMHAWVRQELRSGHGAEPALVARLVTRLATGDADRLSGCHLSVHDDLDAILACGEGVRDRYQLRRAGTPKRCAEPRHRDVAPAVRRARPQAEQGPVPDKQK
jgi:acyl-CoA synthetase (AMP-forming)/AMP-acid ligase II